MTTGMRTDAVTCEMDGNVAVVRFDDGKVNVLTHDVIADLHTALDRAEAEAGAVCMIGREGKFCAGFDLGVMQAGPEEAQGMLRAGLDLFLRIYDFPRPVVAACTGHAIAAGAIWLMSCDVRIGADVKAKIGLNEVAIGMVLIDSVVLLARDRLSRRHFHASVGLAKLYSPVEAVDVGYLDRVVPTQDVESEALSQAAELAAGLSMPAFAGTRHYTRKPVSDAIRAIMDKDTRNFTVEGVA